MKPCHDSIRNRSIQAAFGIPFLALVFLAACAGGTSTSTPPPTASVSDGGVRGPKIGAGPAASRSSMFQLPHEVKSSQLLNTLGQLPASFKEQGIWFADYRRALELAEAPRPRTLEEYLLLSADERDAYSSSRRGLVLRNDLVSKTREGSQQWEEAFGFGMFNVDLSVSVGSFSTPPLQLAYLEGDFRKEAMRDRLLNLGYQERFVGESVYYAIRGDYEADIRNPVGRRALSSMNRVVVEEGTLVAAPDTDRVVKVLELSAGDRPALDDDVMFSSLAASLGDPLSAALLTRSAVLQPERGSSLIYDKPEEWGALHGWEALGAGYVIADGSTWWGLSLFYPDPEVAGADAEELVRRMSDHKTEISLIHREPSKEAPGQDPKRPFDEYCRSLSPRVRSDENGSTLTAWCKVGNNASGDEWWSVFLDMRDLGFLLP